MENSDFVLRTPEWRSDPRRLRFSGYLKQVTSLVRPDRSGSQAQLHISITWELFQPTGMQAPPQSDVTRISAGGGPGITTFKSSPDDSNVRCTGQELSKIPPRYPGAYNNV